MMTSSSGVKAVKPIVFSLSILVMASCNSEVDKPSEDQLRSCFLQEMNQQITTNSFEKTDGLSSQKDGVNYYDAFFDAEFTPLSNFKGLMAGDCYKVKKGTLKFFKTENGWNCESISLSLEKCLTINTSNETSNTPDLQKIREEKTVKEINEGPYPGIYPECSERYIDLEELSQYNKSDLVIMRNEIFARHGYIFRTKKMWEYFQAQPWYEPRLGDVNERLSEIEKENIKVLLEAEKAR